MRRVLSAAVVALLVSAGLAGLGHARGADYSEQAGVVYAARDGHDLHLDAFTPAGDGPHSAVILVHGGGWRSGSRQGWRHTGRRLATEGIAAFSIDYRLSGEAPFPAARDDVQEAIRWVRKNAARYRVDPARIAVMGGSAGANLALVAATTGSGAATVDDRVAAVVAWSPPVDLTSPPTPLLDELTEEYLGCDPADCKDAARAASPSTHVDPTDPPALLVTSADEIVPASEAQQMTRRLTVAQVENHLVVLPGDGHGSEYRDVVWGDTVEFLRTHLGG